MLSIKNLDDESYNEIFEKARNMIAGIYPEWTDYNEHDPGITFLQLFSWMKEMQQFHLDQIGEEHLKMYLKMLGMEQQRKLPASTLVEIRGVENSFLLPQGTRLQAGPITFETIQDEMLEKVELLECVCITKEGERHIGRDMLNLDSKLRCFPFGEVPEADNQFLLKFEHALHSRSRHSIYFEVFDDYAVKRNPIDKDFYPLAKLEVEYYGEAGFAPCSMVLDQTNQLLHSGIMEYEIDGEMKPMEDGTYGVRIRLINGEYDVSPILQSVSVNVIPVRQEATMADYADVCLQVDDNGVCCYYSNNRLFIEGKLELYQVCEKGYIPVPRENIILTREWNQVCIRITPLTEGGAAKEQQIHFRIVGYDADFANQYSYEMTGFPNQMLYLNDDSILYDGIALMTRLPETPTLWNTWDRVENFHCSAPEDLHFRFNEEKGIVTFGDCERGLAPEGNLKIIRYIQSLGSRGNVRKGQIQRFENEQIKAYPNNRDNVSNGSDKENIEKCFARYRMEFQKNERAITAEDYEALVLQTPGLRIQRAKVVPVEMIQRGDGSIIDNCVSIVVQPFSRDKQAKLSEAYTRNIYRLLNRRRLVGTKVQLLSPEYIGVTVFVDAVVKPHYPMAHQRIEAVVKEYFENTRVSFGAVLEENELYGLLDAEECVREVRNLAIHAQGKGVRRTLNGNVKLPVNGLTYLKQADYMITTGEN